MDKYEFNIKVEQIRKLVNREDFETAKKITDAIDWKRVHNANLLSMVSQVYEKNRDYRTAKEILLMAFERAPIGKRLLYKLTELALKEGNGEDAEAYYREFCEAAGDDPRQHLLRYMVLRQKGAPLEQRIHSLESYLADELDEKWMYELAVLYQKAGDMDRCISTCDKLMLMFGLGKYVDKAMDLKVQYAPLNKYQMDLVENREKYEANLRASAHSYEGDEEEYAQDQEGDSPTDFQKEALEESAATYEEEILEAEVKQAETEEHLAKELSRMKMEPPVGEEDELGKTRILGDIRRSRPVNPENYGMKSASPSLEDDSAQKSRLEERMSESEPVEEKEPMSKSRVKSEPSAEIKPMAEKEDAPEEDAPESQAPAYHLMIEARNPEKGLDVAVQLLKRIRQETGVKNPVAKITGSKLNRRGIQANKRKLAGKDLMIEEAGDMTSVTIKELQQLISQDKTGMRIILIDNPKQMEMLLQKNPSLSEWFIYIDEREYMDEDEASQASAASPESSRSYQTEEEYPEDTIGAYLSGATYGEENGYTDYGEYPQNNAYLNNEESDSGEGPQDSGSKEQEFDDRPVRRVVPVRDTAMRAPDGDGMYLDLQPDEGDSEEEMDIDEFAQYACEYASSIDCSITGKSMLAMYERIEIMEEDGIRLTRANAEALIEEAADRAEKPSLGKAIKGIFSSKYNKDGLLILKEEHFI